MLSSKSILDWPAHGDATLGQDQFLAPFFDVNGNGDLMSQMMVIILTIILQEQMIGCKLCLEIKLYSGYLMIKEIFIQKLKLMPLGLEIHAQAFGFTADNEVNDMTFYNYKIINRSTLPLNDTYFGQWVDADLGNYLDDYVGCDVNLRARILL